jgi:hypothetical protein
MPDPHQVLPAGQHRLLVEPEQLRRELVRDLGPRRGRHEHVTARDVELIGEAERHRLPRRGLGLVAIRAEQPRDAARQARSRDRHRVAHRDPPAGDRARDAAEACIGPVDPLHRQAEGRRRGLGADLHLLEMRQQRRPPVPGHPGRARGHIVPVPRRERDGHRAGEAEAAEKPSHSATIRAKMAASKPTRSILFTASTRWRMPSVAQIVAWRLVCASSPLPASTSSTARSELDAPVAMFRVNCSCPACRRR